MAQPDTRQGLVDYALRQLGAPVVEINIADEQIDDLLDDAIQTFHERHYDGVIQTFLKYKVTQDDIDRGKARPQAADGDNNKDIASTTATTSYPSSGTTTATWYENSNYIPVPPSVIGINKIFQYDDAQSISVSNMFSFKYQLFLNDIYYLGSTNILSYSMAMNYLETLNFLLNTHKQVRFNQRQDRLYLDIDYNQINVGDYIVLDCWRTLDPNDYSRVYNDTFLKRYFTAIMKRQWGQNLIKFSGVKLPGGIEFNGRQLYDDGQREVDEIRTQMLSTYEIPPLDLIG
jgi:hypothetical protein|tara:strand:- start:6264 stop:7127 length:864 start_codon:yes stop_codon:yes gene_type:complete